MCIKEGKKQNILYWILCYQWPSGLYGGVKKTDILYTSSEKHIKSYFLQMIKLQCYERLSLAFLIKRKEIAHHPFMIATLLLTSIVTC